MYRVSSVLTAVVCFGTVGCNPGTVRPITNLRPPPGTEIPACIDVSPRLLEFSSLAVSPEEPPVEEKTVTVSNLDKEECGGVLEIAGIEFRNVSHEGVFKIANLEQVALQPGEGTQFAVTFSPRTAGDFTGRIEVQSSDPNAPTEIVRVEGGGIAPKIQVTPESYDFGAPYIGCDQGQPYTITNEGNADLVVEDAVLYTGADTQFSVDTDPATNGPLPFTLSPFDASRNGPAVDVYLDFVPLDTFKKEAFVTFNSNDPFLPAKNVDAVGSGTKYGENLDVFEQPLRSATDILFSMDRSCSMYDEVESVLTNLDTFVGTLASLDADYHAAIVVGDNGCIVGPDGYIDNTFSESAAVDAFRTMADWDRSLAPYGSNTERQLMLMEAALSNKNIGAGGCNADFYRKDAFLSMVGVTDEPDQSVNSWSYYVNLFQSLKANPDDIKVNAVAGDYPSGCGSAAAGTGIYEATVATGGLFLSICATDWSEKLENLAAESVSINDSFELTKQPVPQTIEVKIDGQRVNVGWEYDITSNSVVFDRERIPAGGSTVEITYEQLPDCSG